MEKRRLLLLFLVGYASLTLNLCCPKFAYQTKKNAENLSSRAIARIKIAIREPARQVGNVFNGPNVTGYA